MGDSKLPEAASSPNTAVWYFVAATFLFAGSVLLRGQIGAAGSFMAMIAGAIVLVVGILVFRKERR